MYGSYIPIFKNFRPQAIRILQCFFKSLSVRPAAPIRKKLPKHDCFRVPVVSKPAGSYSKYTLKRDLSVILGHDQYQTMTNMIIHISSRIK